MKKGDKFAINGETLERWTAYGNAKDGALVVVTYCAGDDLTINGEPHYFYAKISGVSGEHQLSLDEVREWKAPRREAKVVGQQQVVLDHLRRAPYITGSQASSLYGIGQVALVVHRLRKKGYNIKTTLRDCIKPGATKYAEYSLA